MKLKLWDERLFQHVVLDNITIVLLPGQLNQTELFVLDRKKYMRFYSYKTSADLEEGVGIRPIRFFTHYFLKSNDFGRGLPTKTAPLRVLVDPPLQNVQHFSSLLKS